MSADSKNQQYDALPHCADCMIRVTGVCSGATAVDLRALEQAKVYRRFGPGETIALAGSRMTHIGTVMSGVCTLARTQGRGTRQIVGLLQPGDFLGRPWRTISPFDVETATAVELCGFRPAVFEGLLDRMDGLRRRMMEMMLDELDAARSWLTILARKTAREKLASLLVNMTLRQNTAPLRGKPCRVDIMLSREQIADLLSMTFETVSRQLTSLAREGLILPVTRRVFDVPDLHALMQASGEDADGGFFHV